MSTCLHVLDFLGGPVPIGLRPSSFYIVNLLLKIKMPIISIFGVKNISRIRGMNISYKLMTLLVVKVCNKKVKFSKIFFSTAQHVREKTNW